MKYEKKYEKYDIHTKYEKYEVQSMADMKPGELKINLLDRFISENMRLTPLLSTPVLEDFNFTNVWKIERNLCGSTSQRRYSACFFYVEVS